MTNTTFPRGRFTTRSGLLLAPVLALSAVVGCGGPGPEEACGKYMELRAADDRASEDSDRGTCQDVLGDFKEDNPQAWKCVNGCIGGAGDSRAADECPWSCESQYGGADGEGVSGSEAKLALQEKWARGINGDALTAREAAEETIKSASGGEAAVIEGCVTECKAKTKGKPRPDYSACFDTCKASKGG